MTQQELKDLIARAATEGWITLDLRDQDLTELPSDIGKLTTLKILWLGRTTMDSIGNHLTELPPEIGQLTNLTELVLSFNQLTIVPPEICQLTNLTTLDLNRNQLKVVPPAIVELINLTWLALIDNQLTIVPPAIGQLANLTELYLDGNQLAAVPREIDQFTNLAKLSLRNNQLISIPPEIGQLINLTTLVLDANELTVVPSEIGQLPNLTTLYLRDNRLTTIPPEIGHLTNLTNLYLSENRLTAVPPEIGQLANLTTLDLSGNQLTAVPPKIGQLANLIRLYLGGNQLTSIPPEIGQLANLTAFVLRHNQLVSVPPEIGQLTNLTTLHLSDNQLTAVPPEIGQIANLTTLSLDRNRLEGLPLVLRQLMHLKHLDLLGNINLGLSPEILIQMDNPSLILDSYFADRRPLREAKLLLVGEADVGKTALARRLLLDLPPDPNQDKTPGIDIHKWEITPTTDEPPLTLNIWDFGGQGVYQATHQFFFTHRSLYLVVISSRRGDNESRLHHWLRLVSSLSDSAPIIVVANKQDQHRLALDERALKAQYPNLLAVIPTSCLTGSGIDELRQTIAAALAHLPHLNDTFPTAWFGLKQRLETMPRSYVTYEQYCDYCQEAGIDNRAHQRSWVQVLHQLGVVLNFQDRQLTATHVLKPNWVTDGIYRILSDGDGDIVANGGVLTYRHLDTLLDPEAYPPAQHSFIVGMMQKFELCFPLPHRPNQFLIPDLLPEQQPDLPQLGFTGTAPALRFQYHYPDVLPNTILPRFMVGMMTMLDRAHSWRSGAILQFEQNHALVQADSQNRKITITILGGEATRRALLTSVRMQLAAIHSSFANLKVEEHVPIPTLPGQSVSYRSLCNLETRGIDYHYNPDLDIDLDVKQLLAGIETPAQRRELQLLEQLNAQSNLEEVRQLCFKLGVDYENLEGETKSAKTRALVQLLGRLGRLDELAAALERP
ncbi:MAG: leucine-rich repeat domain-containing protein [Anaerolineales bacterium]|nr:leucine-rich repeat domain-containing protein [Anaerolineales bacterium]